MYNSEYKLILNSYKEKFIKFIVFYSLILYINIKIYLKNNLF